MTGPHSILSFQSELVGTSSTGAVLVLEPKDSEAGIIFLAFSVVVVTEENPYVELMLFNSTTLTPGSSPLFLANSTKFNLTGSTESPASVVFYQWVTGRGGYSSSSINYWTDISFSTTYSRPSEVRITLSLGSSIYMTGVKLAILMVSKVINSSTVNIYETYSMDGIYYSRIFNSNLGVNTTLFGEPSTGQQCFSGLKTIHLYFYNTTSTNTNPTSFLFTYNGSTIDGLTYSNVYGCRISTICMGLCPLGN